MARRCASTRRCRSASRCRGRTCGCATSPLGPVAVFGASNFPLAFSVAGGDTASALAAGCPVIVKGHPAHPGTGELVGRAVQAAVADCGLPEGVFSLLLGAGARSARRWSPIRASRRSASPARAAAAWRSCSIAAARPEPIPVYAEMSSINPVYLLPGRAGGARGGDRPRLRRLADAGGRAVLHQSGPGLRRSRARSRPLPRRGRGGAEGLRAAADADARHPQGL